MVTIKCRCLPPVLMDVGTTALVITTHHDSHARWVTQGLAAGKAVFEEKPLCLTLEALAAIAAVAGSLSPGPSPTRGGGEQEWQRRGGGDSNPLPPAWGRAGVRACEKIQPAEQTGRTYQAHATAIVDEGAQIGQGTRIWHWVHTSAPAPASANAAPSARTSSSATT